MTERIQICEICGKNGTKGFLRHHIVPREVGGTDEEKNIILICTICHGLLHSMYKSKALHFVMRTVGESFFRSVLETVERWSQSAFRGTDVEKVCHVIEMKQKKKRDRGERLERAAELRSLRHERLFRKHMIGDVK